jgi:hypothetical protein
MVEATARAACGRATRDTGLPASDTVRFGAAPLARAVLEFAAARAATSAAPRRERRPGATPA